MTGKLATARSLVKVCILSMSKLSRVDTREYNARKTELTVCDDPVEQRTSNYIYISEELHFAYIPSVNL
jgi:hypothetical protein